MLPKFVKFANFKLARNIVSAKKLKVLSTPLVPTLAIWPITLAKNENTETEEESSTKNASLWKLFTFECKLENKENKSWFEKLFETEKSCDEEPLKKKEKFLG